MVLVRNDGELPWAAPGSGRSRPPVGRGDRSVAVIGHNALQIRTQRGGSATVTPPYVISPLDELRTALPDAEITWTLGAITQAGEDPTAEQTAANPSRTTATGCRPRP